MKCLKEMIIMLTTNNMCSTIVEIKTTAVMQYYYMEKTDMKETLSRHEWILMEALWERNPMFLSEIMEATRSSVDWNSSSYSTYLKRMTDKGLLIYKTISGNRCYKPKIRREDCIETESSYILSKLTKDSKRLLLASMIQKSGLSEKDRDELKQLITKLKKTSEKEKEYGSS